MRLLILQIAAWLGLLPWCFGGGPPLRSWADQDTVQGTDRKHYFNRCLKCRFRENCAFAGEEEQRLKDEEELDQ